MSELPEGWDATIHAPWTTEQVRVLNQFQHGANIHPFTCGGECRPRATLVATIDGWYCPQGCDYRQNWAPKYMTDPQVLEALRFPFPPLGMP